MDSLLILDFILKKGQIETIQICSYTVLNIVSAKVKLENSCNASKI